MNAAYTVWDERCTGLLDCLSVFMRSLERDGTETSTGLKSFESSVFKNKNFEPKNILSGGASFANNFCRQKVVSNFEISTMSMRKNFSSKKCEKNSSGTLRRCSNNNNFCKRVSES